VKVYFLLEDAVNLSFQRQLTDLEKEGLIQRFEFTHELVWNVLKDYFSFQGATQITGSRDATREAFSNGLIVDGDGWMNMIRDRNRSSHIYNQGVADQVIDNEALLNHIDRIGVTFYQR